MVVLQVSTNSSKGLFDLDTDSLENICGADTTELKVFENEDRSSSNDILMPCINFGDGTWAAGEVHGLSQGRTRTFCSLTMAKS